MPARPVNVASKGDCMANAKENLFPVGIVGLNKGLNKKGNVAVYQVVAKLPNVVVCLLILILYVREQVLV